jgi:hypothetical protein
LASLSISNPNPITFKLDAKQSWHVPMSLST